PEDEESIVRVLGNLARLFAKQQRWADAAGQLADMILTDRPDPARPLDAVSRAIGLALDAKADPATAEPILRECRDVLDRKMIGGDWLRAEIGSRYGECLMKSKRYTEAEPVLVTADREMAKAVGIPAWSRRAACRRVIELYEATKQQEKVA